MKQIVLTIICCAVLCPLTLSQNNTNQEKLKLEHNKAVVRGYMDEVLNKGNLAAFDSYFSTDVVMNNSKDLKRQLAGIQSIRSAFPDFHLAIEDQIAEGDKVVTRVRFQGTHRGEYRGVAPTGKQVRYSGIAIDRIAGGKVVEMWHIADTLALLQQLGAIPSLDTKPH
jgi:predicted ester cyclase